MTLRICYRATCDAPGCTAVEVLPQDRTGPARLLLSTLGWSVLEYRVSASGAPRLVYACPAHHDWQPEDDGLRLVLTAQDRRSARCLKLRRAAMLWLLREAGASRAAVAAGASLSVSRVHEVTEMYGRVLQARERKAAAWTEPWARRLRAAGAIP